MQFAVLALNDAGVGVLADGRVLQGKGVTPMGSVVADGNGEGRADAFLGAWQRGEVVVDEHMTTVLHCYGISARLVVGNVEQGDWSPCVTIVGGEGCANLAVAGAHEHLQTSVLQFQDRRLDAVNRVATILRSLASGIGSLDVFLVALGTGGFHVLAWRVLP